MDKKVKFPNENTDHQDYTYDTDTPFLHIENGFIKTEKDDLMFI